MSLVCTIQWPRLGPYHIARIRGAQARLLDAGISLIALEIASRDEVYAWREEAQTDSYTRHTIFKNRVYEQIGWHELVPSIFESLDRISPDIVAVNGYFLPDSWATILWASIRNRPMLLMTESKADDYEREVWKEFLKRKIIGRFDAAICGGTPHKRYLQSLGMMPERIFTGYDVVDNEYFCTLSRRVRTSPFDSGLPGLESPKPFFMASARFIPRKNLQGLLSAFEVYVHMCRNTSVSPWRLIILGDGIQRQNLEELVIRLGLTEIVTFAGFRQIDELPEYYGRASAFIHPPFQEQWGLVVNEAMASALPVVVSRQCGCSSDLVFDGFNGYKFDAEDSERLAQILYLLSNGDVDHVKLGENAFETILEWGPERFGNAMLAAIEIAYSSRNGSKN